MTPKANDNMEQQKFPFMENGSATLESFLLKLKLKILLPYDPILARMNA